MDILAYQTLKTVFKEKNTALILFVKIFLGVIFNIILHTCFISMTIC